MKHNKNVKFAMMSERSSKHTQPFRHKSNNGSGNCGTADCLLLFVSLVSCTLMHLTFAARWGACVLSLAYESPDCPVAGLRVSIIQSGCSILSDGEFLDQKVSQSEISCYPN